MLDSAPLWLVFLCSVVLVLGSILVGFRLGKPVRMRQKGPPEAPIGSIVGALLGLLAFILTFTFGMASNRFDSRRQLLLDEVNAIDRTALRAEMLTEPERSNCLALFRKYVDLRVDMVRDPATVRRALAASDTLQHELWANAVAMAGKMNTPVGGLFINSLNEVIDLQTSRKTVALLYRIPWPIWLGLGVITVLAMGAVGFQFGISGDHHWGLSLVLAVTFSTVILLVTMLDRPFGDVLKVNQGAMIELQHKLHETAP